MKSDNVAVLIPAFNEEKTISSTLKSLHSQTHKPLVIVVINDGSTDKTAEIVNDFISKSGDGSIQLLSLKRSIGYAGGIARNLIIGKRWLDRKDIAYHYLMVLDADQRLSPDYIELCVSHFDPATAMVSGRTHGVKFNPIQPRGAHRIYAKWFVDYHPFPLVEDYDSPYFFLALEHDYKVKVISNAIAFEEREARSTYGDDFSRGMYSHKLGYSIPFIIGRSIAELVRKHRPRSILMIYGYLFSMITGKKRYAIHKKISLHQQQRIKRMIMGL